MLTGDPNLVALLFECDRLVDVEAIRVNDRLLEGVDAQSLVGLFSPRSKDERVARVLPQAVPTMGASQVGGKVLFTDAVVRVRGEGDLSGKEKSEVRGTSARVP
jgi:hypothetical protein